MIDLEQRLKQMHYKEGPYAVFTELAHLERGSCCGSGCRHCPFFPRFKAGNRKIDLLVAETLDNQLTTSS